MDSHSGTEEVGSESIGKASYETFEAEKKAKVKMSEEMLYAKLDKSIASTTYGPIYTMGKDETGGEFINRLLFKAE